MLWDSEKMKKTFDPKLCLVFQKSEEDSKQGRPWKKGTGRFKVFTEVCKMFERYKVLQVPGGNQK